MKNQATICNGELCLLHDEWVEMVGTAFAIALFAAPILYYVFIR